MRTIMKVAAGLILAACSALAAGSCTNAEGLAPIRSTAENGQQVYSLYCTADSSGNLSGNPFQVEPGDFTQIRIVPGTAGDAPTSGFSLTIVDPGGIDLLGGGGAAITAGGYRNPQSARIILAVINRTLDVVGTGIGANKKVRVDVFIDIRAR